MRYIGGILKRIRGVKELFSNRFINLSQLDYYRPNKGGFKIWIDNFKNILKQGCCERGYWMYGFFNKTKSEQDKYIDYETFRVSRIKINTQPKVTFTTGDRYNYLCLLRDKFVFGRFLSSLNYPVAQDYLIIDGERNQLIPIDNYNGMSEQEPIENLINYNFDGFCKIISGECGKGVFKLHSKDGKLSGEIDDIEQLKSIIGDSQFILQERLKQHPVLSKVYPHSINTLRLITILSADGVVQTIPSVIRFGANGNTMDNWAAGGLVVAIDSNGILRGEGIYEFPINNKITESHHPDTNVKFDGYEIPYYKNAVEMARNLHRHFYGIPCIGWDIAFTENGPVFIEGNDNFEISLNQAAHGGLKDKWMKAIEGL